MLQRIKKIYLFAFAMLMAVSGTALWYTFVNSPPSKGFEIYTQHISEKVNTEIKLSQEELASVGNQLVNLNSALDNIRKLTLKYPVFIFSKGNLVYWSEYKFVPKYSSVSGNETSKFVRFPIGKFVVNKITVKNGLEIYSCIPLAFEYSIENNYIQSEYNKEIFNHDNIEINNFPSAGSFPVYTSQHSYLFSLDYLSATGIVEDSILYGIIALFFLSIAALLALVYKIVNDLVQRSKILSAAAVLLVSLVSLRAFLLVTKFPFSIFEFKLFNSKYFASSEISPSLGDLLINVVFFSFLSWFILNNYHRIHLIRKLIEASRTVKRIGCFFLSAFSLLILLYLSYIFSEIYSNSQYSLDITESIYVNVFKLTSLLIFILASGIYFIYNHISLRLYMLLSTDTKSFRNFLPLIFVSLVAVSVAIYWDIHNWILIPINLFYWISLIFFSLPGNLGTLKYTTYLYFLLTAFICSFTGAVNLYYVNENKTIIEKHKYAFQLLNENDLFAEYLVSESLEKIGKDKFIISRLKSIFQSHEVIEQKIQKIILPSYLEKFEVNVSIFDYNGNVTVQNAEYTDYFKAKEDFATDTFKTDYENVYFVNEKLNSPLKRYISFKDFYENGIFYGGIIIELLHQKNSPNSVYPELLVDKKFISPKVFRNYQYAIYDDSLLLSKGNFNFEKYITKDFLNNPDLYHSGFDLQGFHHLGIKSKDGKIVIVSSEEYSDKNILSNFSFLFFLLLVFVLLFIGGYMYYFRYRKLHMNYATKILVYLNVAFFLPLFIVSIITLSLISNYYKTSQQKSFIKKAEDLSANIQEHLENYQTDENWEYRLENDIAELADFTDSDINLYNEKGELLYSYHPAIFDRNLLSRYLNPEAFFAITEGRMNEVLLNESLGKLKYNAVYLSVRSNSTGELLGIISIPFFESRDELNQQLIGILTTTLNIFSLIFIAFAGLSYFASRILTSPLNIITQKIRKTTFGDNKPLDWDSKDEIGLLISEYNSMLLKLEESRVALSQSEKESAWREMAKQVAHEIKNPLTPMKLKIQHLQRTWKEKDDESSVSVQKGLQSLLDQVNILSEIASSFSAFAKMPIPKNEKFELSGVLNSTIHLYNNTHDVHVDSSIEPGDFIVEGDEQLMGAIFTNLIINAIQSVPFTRKPKVEILLSRVNTFVQIEIKDNGSGISELIKDKIFLPNFSTKETGSGIGLAVAKRGVEHAGGRIWFETQKEVGTSFFIEIPLVN